MRILKIYFLIFILPVTLFAQWYDKSNGLPEIYGYAWAIDAYDSLIATGPYTQTPAPEYIPDSLYLTTDGGNNWFTRPLPDDLERLDDLYDISIIGRDKIWFCTGGGKIFHTTDGGFNWQLQFYDTSMTKLMNYIEMLDSLNGMAMGDPSTNDKPAVFLKTTNGGLDWVSQNDNSLIGLWAFDLWRGVDFVDLNQGYFYRNSTVYKTTNSGKDWEVILDGEFCYLLKGYDENILLAEGPDSGEFGTMFRTLDGGKSWEGNQFDFLSWGFDIEYIPGIPSNVWYASYAVCFSSDTGRTWTEEFRLYNFFFRDIVFTDANNGWLLANQTASGFKSRIFRTTNGGFGGIVSVNDNTMDFKPDGFSLEQNYPNPFNPTTTINFQIPELNFVTLKVYDVLGNEVATLVNQEKPEGSYEVQFDGANLTSGIYFSRIQAGEFVETKKMILIK